MEACQLLSGKENYFTTSSSNNVAIINTALKELEDGASQLEVTPVKTYNGAETQTEPLPHNTLPGD